MLDVTTLARVKVFLRKTDGIDDALLQALITGYSEMFEDLLGKPLKREAKTEQYDVIHGQKIVFLRAQPVLASPTPEFRNDTVRDFTVDAIDAERYYLNLALAYVEFDVDELFKGPGVFEAKYTGGMAVDTATFITSFPKIALACDQQAAFIFQRKDELGLTGFSAEGGSISQLLPTDLLPGVEKILRLERRMVLSA